MSPVLLILLVYLILQSNASPLHPHSDYLDPILYQEYIQSLNGRYNYGHQSNTAVAQQVHDAPAKGFYSFVDDQGKIQTVKYKAGHGGFKVLESNAVPIYTPEVEAARKAHLEAYSAALRRAFEDQRAAHNRVLSASPFLRKNSFGDAMKVQEEAILGTPKTNYYNNNIGISQYDINLFSGEPISRHRMIRPIDNQFITTTARPTNNNLEIKHFILPSPIVHRYEKIWPLPPLKFRDLAIEVNGQDRYDPRVQFQHWNNEPYVPRPSASLTPSNTSLAFQNILVQKPVQPPSRPKFHTAVGLTALTAHQADILKYRQGFSIDTSPIRSDAITESKNRFVGVNPVTKVVVTKSHVDTKQGGAASVVEKAFENALNNFKAKYNLSV